MCHGHSTQDALDCKKVGVFLQIGLKETKEQRNDIHAREAREPHIPYGHVRREKKNRLSVFDTMSSL